MLGSVRVCRKKYLTDSNSNGFLCGDEKLVHDLGSIVKSAVTLNWNCEIGVRVACFHRKNLVRFMCSSGTLRDFVHAYDINLIQS